MSYLSEETHRYINKLPRVYPVRPEFWRTTSHTPADTQPLVVNTDVLTAYEVAKLIQPDLPLTFHKDDLHNWIML